MEAARASGKLQDTYSRKGCADRCCADFAIDDFKTTL